MGNVFSNETIQDFYAKLKNAFSDVLDKNLLGQFLKGLKYENVQSKLIAQVDELTFMKAVKKFITMDSRI